MCTYQTATFSLRGSGKGASGWFSLTDASVYFDHPVHYPAGHALAIDFLNPTMGPGARVAVEMDAQSARDLANSILATLDGVPGGLLAEDPAH